MELLLSALALILLMAAGLGVLLLLLSRKTEIDPIELASLSFLLGCALISSASFLLGFVMKGALLQGAVSLLALSLLATGILRARKQSLRIGGLFPSGGRDVLLILVLLLQTGFVFWFSAHTGLGWDGVFHWEIKARLASGNGGVLPLSYLTERALWSSHRGYPLLLPLTESWFYGWMGGAHQGLIKLLFPLFFAAGLGVLATASGKRSILPPVLLSFIPLVQFGDGSVPSGYADFPLAVYYLACTIGILRLGNEKSDNGARVLAVLFCVLPWLKQDGNILFLILAFLLAIRLWSTTSVLRELGRRMFSIIWPGVVVIFFWTLFVRLFKTPVEQFYLTPSPATMLRNLDRLPLILQWYGGEWISWVHWGALWPAYLAGAVSLLILGKWKGLIPVLAVALPLLTYGFIYLFVATDRISMDEWLLTSLSRLMLHVAPTAILSVAWPFMRELSGIWPSKSVDYPGSNSRSA